MIELRTQKDLRTVQNLAFCCICGEPFRQRGERTRHHLPPKAIFAEVDRNPPLILPAHGACNRDQSPLDTVIAQLVAVRHGKYPARKNLKLEVATVPLRGGQLKAGVTNLPLRPIIFRWVRCFHAALYREYLIDRGGMIFEPFQTADVVAGQLVFSKIPMDRPFLTDLFKQQARAGRTDTVVCYNEKCVYRCSWLKTDDGRPFCLFALRLYDWERLGDPDCPRMGCLGWYWASAPPNCATGVHLELAVANLVPLDPFAS